MNMKFNHNFYYYNKTREVWVCLYFEHTVMLKIISFHSKVTFT